MSGDDLLHPALRQATAQGVDVRIRCLEEMEAADQRPDRLAGKGLLRLPDDDIRPGVTAAVENNQAPGEKGPETKRMRSAYSASVPLRMPS